MALLAGGALQIFVPLRLFRAGWMGHAIGWPIAIIGLAFALWAVVVVGRMSISAPSALLTSGPYGYSRNPMYVAWALIHLGISFVVNSIWVAAFLPPAFLYVHLVDVRREERLLSQRFGEKYEVYKEEVSRYI